MSQTHLRAPRALPAWCPPEGFDPDSAAEGDGLFGLPGGQGTPAVGVVPVPWEGTVSYRGGTALAPARVGEATAQVDLADPAFGDAWRAGIAWALDPSGDAVGAIARANAEATALAARCREAPLDGPRREQADALGAQVNAYVYGQVASLLDAGRVPIVLGGEHSVAYGGLVAAADALPGLGVLHVDAHADLRDAYEGFAWSHASVMHAALRDAEPGLARLVSVGLRDLGSEELHRLDVDPRIVAFTDDRLGELAAAGQPFAKTAEAIVAELPEIVWVSLDVDGLEPSLCPTTGTPVPGGLTWRELRVLVRALVASGRTILGADLVEVGPGDWDAIVGARLLHLLASAAVASRRA